MSHFAVMVITPTVPTKLELDLILQPWHEFECTGIDDEYIQDVDITADVLEQYEKDTTTVLQDPQGKLHTVFGVDGGYKDEFAETDPDATYRRRFKIPPGWAKTEAPTKNFETAAQFGCGYFGGNVLLPGQERGEEHQYGYALVDENGELVKMVDRTNPNKKWDWWVVGGRWSGHLKLKDGSAVDQCLMRDLDLHGMRREASKDAEEIWQKVTAAVEGLPEFKTWEELGEYTDTKRDTYHNQPAIKALRGAFPDNWGIDDEIRAARSTFEEFKQFKANQAICTFAMVHQGQWMERGEMGWFACVSNKIDEDDWAGQFNAVIDSLPADVCLTVVDCHI